MQQKQISKILHEESQMPEGHSVSSWDAIHLQILLSPLSLWLKPHFIPLSLGRQKSHCLLLQDERNGKDRKSTNTVDLQILFYNNDKSNKKTSSYGKEREVGLRSSRTPKTGRVSDSRRYRTF